jgi:hypothetical protein
LPSVFFVCTVLNSSISYLLRIFSYQNNCRMIWRFLSGLLLMFSVLVSCHKVEPVFEYRIEPQLEVLVAKFYQEAELRGISLQRNNLIVEFVENLEDDRCGQCERPKRKREEQRHLKISKIADCWAKEPSQNQEALVFHELGHCLLNRDHKDDLFPSGAPKSIMTTVLNGPYEPCVYVFGEDGSVCNKTVRRTYYLNELFNENLEEVPAWAN